MTFPIAEIFGPTIQGEGFLAGEPSIFIRFGGCDYHCSWCDSLFAVEAKFRESWQKLSVDQVLEQVGQLAGRSRPLINLTGGNPAIHKLKPLILELKSQGYAINLETQASVARDWFADCDFITLSPKGPSAGEYKPRLAECIAAAKGAAVSLKIVIADREDYEFARQVAADYPEVESVVFQPVNDASQAQPDCRELFLQIHSWMVEDEFTKARLLPQLHVWAWGSKRGV